MAFLKFEKPKPFTYIPRFYDERKEELKNQINSIKQETEAGSEGTYVPNIRGRMRSRHEALYGAAAKPGKKAISRRFLTIVYIGFVLAIIYYIIRILSVAG
jgi:hypothetical protein